MVVEPQLSANMMVHIFVTGNILDIGFERGGDILDDTSLSGLFLCSHGIMGSESQFLIGLFFFIKNLKNRK